MEKRRAETVINKPADDVWARVGDFGDITWIPNHGDAVMDGDERTVSKPEWGFVLVQRLVNHDDAARTYSYVLPNDLDFSSLLGPGHIVHMLDGTLEVIPDGPSTSLVTWDVETEDFLIGGTHAEYQASLDSLKENLEG